MKKLLVLLTLCFAINTFGQNITNYTVIGTRSILLTKFATLEKTSDNIYVISFKDMRYPNLNSWEVESFSQAEYVKFSEEITDVICNNKLTSRKQVYSKQFGDVVVSMHKGQCGQYSIYLNRAEMVWVNKKNLNKLFPLLKTLGYK